jgi:hypothetical protein
MTKPESQCRKPKPRAMSAAHARITTISVSSSIMHMRTERMRASDTCGTRPAFRSLLQERNISVG